MSEVHPGTHLYYSRFIVPSLWIGHEGYDIVIAIQNASSVRVNKKAYWSYSPPQLSPWVHGQVITERTRCCSMEFIGVAVQSPHKCRANFLRDVSWFGGVGELWGTSVDGSPDDDVHSGSNSAHRAIIAQWEARRICIQQRTMIDGHSLIILRLRCKWYTRPRLSPVLCTSLT